MEIASQNVGLGDRMRRIFTLMLQKVKVKIQRPCYQLIVLQLKDENKITWLLDIVCSNHMCGRKEMFFELDKTFNSEVKFGNDTIVPVKDKCKISIQLKGGS